MTVLWLANLALKSALLAGAGIGVSRLPGLRAVDRVDALRLTVALLVLLPLVSASAPRWGLDWLPIEAPRADVTTAAPLWSGAVQPRPGLTVEATIAWPPVIAWLVMVWVVGASVVLVRLGAGVATLARWTRSGAPLQSEALSGAGAPRVVVSAEAPGPLSWGLGRGVILLDPGSASHGVNAAVLAHEQAHLVRRDWGFTLLSRVVVALFWFNPLVWWLDAELSARSEQAADAAAVRSVDRRTYCHTLVGLAAGRTPASALAMAGRARALKMRIACIMSNADTHRRPWLAGLAVAAVAVVATPLAALELRRPPAPPQVPAPPSPANLPEPPQAPSLADLPEPPLPPAPPAPGDWTEAPEPPLPPLPPLPPEIDANATVYINGVARRPTAEELAAMRDARRQAEAARAQAEQARSEATRARAEVQAHRAEIDAARQQGDEARDLGRQMQAHGEEIRRLAQRQVALARVQMRDGVVQMRQGVVHMRGESERLKDPAYRAQVRERARRDGGREMTDAELLALSPQLARQADDLARRADELERQSRDPA